MQNIKISTTFGARLRKVRKDMGLNQTEFAKKLGFSANTIISRFEKDVSLPTLETLIKLAGLHPVDFHWLITGDTSPGGIAKIEQYKELILRLLPYVSNSVNTVVEKQRMLQTQKKILETSRHPSKNDPALIAKAQHQLENIEVGLKKASKDFACILEVMEEKEQGNALK